MRFPLSRVPAPWNTWLAADVGGVRYFPRQVSAGLALGLAALAALGPLVFLVDLVTRSTHERGDLAAGAVALGVFGLITGWALRERRRARRLADGTLRLGAFVGPDALVWRESPDDVHVFARAEVSAVELTASFPGKGRPVPGDFVVTATSGGAVFPNASDYPAAALLDALVAWGGVGVKVDPALRIVLASPASGASPGAKRGAGASGGASASSSARFVALCRQHGVEVVLVREGYSEGSSLMSIDHPTVYRLSRPLRIRLSLLRTVSEGLGPRDQGWLDAECKQAGGADPEVVVSNLCFSDYTDFVS